MEDTKVVDEFITRHRENKPPYETEERADGTKIVKVDTRRKLKPRDREMIKAFELAGYKRINKRIDITRADMINYVKENYDQEELDLLNKQLNSINSINKENGKQITFATIKSWYNARYIYYPKGINWNFGKTTSAKEKKERFTKVFAEHKKQLQEERRKGGEPKELLNTPKEDTDQEQPQQPQNNNNNNNNNKHHKH